MAVRWLLGFALTVGLVGSGVVFSQHDSQAEAAATGNYEVISNRDWIRMKRQWSKQTDKWSSCNKQANDQNLIGRKGRLFIASCMSS